MSSEFVKRLIGYYPFKINTIQTDNEFEFTIRKRLKYREIHDTIYNAIKYFVLAKPFKQLRKGDE